MLGPATTPHRRERDDEERFMVLVVEDDEDLGRLFARTLRDAGFDVHVAADGAEALAVLAEAERTSAALPHAMLMDVRMPRQSGLDTLRELRARGFSVPVVLVTGFGDAPLRATAIELGASAVLDKPVERDDLVSVVELVLGRPRVELDS
jgi:DNA-binding response OmpR family regulator